MTQQKDFKRVVRARMQKTGESYTTARLHLVKKQEAPVVDYASLAGLSDESVKKATGRTWAMWVSLLDMPGTEFKFGFFSSHGRRSQQPKGQQNDELNEVFQESWPCTSPTFNTSSIGVLSSADVGSGSG